MSDCHLKLAAWHTVQAAEQAAEGNKIFEKIKEALPFGTLPVFDLAEVSKDDANMGPNEVSQELLATGFQNSDNPFDTAMPGLLEAPCSAHVQLSLTLHCANVTGSQRLAVS